MNQSSAASYMRRALVMIPSVPVAAFGVALFLLGNLGADPFTSFQLAVGQLIGISVGTMSVILNVLILVAYFFIDRPLIGFGSIAFAAGMGPCINFFYALLGHTLPNPPSFALALIYISVGAVLLAAAICHYLALNLGAQATDLIALNIAKKTKKTYGFGLSCFNLVLFISAVLLGSPWGIGTLVCVFVVGRLVDWFSHFLNPISKKLAGMQ